MGLIACSCSHGVITLLLLGCLLCRVHGGAVTISADGTRFVDNQNRTVILRGFNLAGDAKLPDYRPLQNLTGLSDLKRFGVNVVRLLFVWEAYEGLRGTYDASYLEYYLRVADHLATLDIYTIVDIHQDAYSRFTLGGCGDGFPSWAIPDRFPRAVPDNSRQNCSGWGPRLVNDQETRRVFEAFFGNESGVRDSYLALIEHLAARTHSRPHVIGFDLLNEPLGDEIRHIAPLYAEAATRVRLANSSALILLTPQFMVGSGFVSTRLPRPTMERAVFSPHFYNFVNLVGSYDFGVFTRAVLRRLLSKSLEWRVPLFLGEFGVFHNRFADLFAGDMYRFMDAHFLSGTQWSYTPNWSADKKDGWNGEDLSVVAAGQTRGFPFTPSPRRLAGIPLTAHAVPHVEYQLTWQGDGGPQSIAAEVYFPVNEFCDNAQIPSLQASHPLDCVFRDSYTILCSITKSGEKGARKLSLRVSC